LVIGVMHPELLEWAARSARRCTALAPNRRAGQGARAFADRNGFACRVLKVAGNDARFGAELALSGAHFDALLLDHPAPSGEALVQMLGGARSPLAPEGWLWISEPYESLEGSRQRVIEHPLARLRRLLGAARLRCERLSPIEADGEHVLAAVARPIAAGAGRAPPPGGGARQGPPHPRTPGRVGVFSPAAPPAGAASRAP